ncbi:hypothetical protein NBM05_14085 [Rothia sp. AR01]|uniref:Orc1-like AAA ATPase domain-containing protein n=1 Tax=Rothia santali TaxID=2949643 RepID=A0A9X2HCH1_9MICC|nr:hypothetical protein [Rothia santali]MCP3427109.1 hypothetical protein [Rothia santali]
MGFYFSRVVDEVGRALMAGANVRLTGVQGSGRSAVMDRLAERLGRLGHTVHRGGGGQLPRRMSGQLIAQLGIPWPPAGSSAATGVDAAVDRLCAAWSAEGHPVLLLDDAHEIDAVSAGILARAVRRMRVPVVRAVRHGVADPEDLDRPVSAAAEVGVAMPAMTADDVVEMAAQLLGAPPEPMLAARVLAKSGGIPGLSASIITTARVAGHIELAFGQWRVASDSLWNQHLAPVIDARLQGLPRAEREALAVIALRGAAAPAELIAAHPAEALVGLERRGLLAEAAEGGARRIHVWPPILADRYQRGLSTLARMALTGDAAGDLPPVPTFPANRRPTCRSGAP